MKKIYSLLIATLFLCSSCKENGANIPNNDVIKDIEMVHTYSISSSAPIEITFIVASGLDDIYFNKVNEKTSMLTKTVSHEGVKEYNIHSTSEILDSQIIFSSNDEAEISYSWRERKNGKEAKSDKQTITVSGVAQSKNYITVSE